MEHSIEKCIVSNTALTQKAKIDDWLQRCRGTKENNELSCLIGKYSYLK